MAKDDEEKRLRTVALQNAQIINLARRRAEEDLRKQSEWLRVTLASIGDAVISTDPEGRVTFMNGVAQDLTGWSQTEALGRPLPDIFHIVNELTRLPVENPTVRALREGRAVGLANHTILIARDGTERPIDDSAAPMRNESGVSIGTVLVFRDVTERKKAEQELRESEGRYRRAAAEAAQAAEANAKFRAFFEQGTNFAGVLALDGTVVEANRLCLDGCGFSREDVVGKPFWECGWWNRSVALMEMVRDACLQAAGGRMFRVETVYFVAGGAERVVDLMVAPVTDSAGDVLFLAATGTDVTERRHMEDTLREQDQRKNEFLALLAHELRNPLAPLRNGLHLMRLAEGDPKVIAQTRGMMERQLGHMVRLIDDLLDISRISCNKIELRRARVRLADVVNSAVETSRPLIEAARHELTLSLPQEPVWLDADLTRLAQVFGNLLTNSAKYTEPGGRIWLTARRVSDQVAVVVGDTGIGIPKSALPQIFDMFSQVDRSIERSTGGLGIGLALVKGLVELHGGKVEAASAGEGKGSTITVMLPVLTEPAKAAPETSVDESSPNSGIRRRILLVDDNRDSASSMAMMLRFIGDEVRTAHDGMEAVDAAENFRPQVILMDVGMPLLNGYEATRRIREKPWGQSPIIIALTGWGQDGDKARSKEAGCDGHLVKPVKLSEVEKLLAELIGSAP
jgi:PAS domain S-box-containing protein